MKAAQTTRGTVVVLVLAILCQLAAAGENSALYYTAGEYAVGARNVHSLLQYSGDNLVLGLTLGEIVFYNLDTYSVIAPVNLPSSGGPPVYSLIKLLDSRLGSSGTVNGDLRMRVFDAAGNLDSSPQMDVPRTLMQLSDGRMASETVVGSIQHFDYAVAIWDLASGSILKLLQGHTDRISALVEIDADTLAASSLDGLIYVWNISESQLILTPSQNLTGHEAPVNDLVLLASGNLASCANDQIFVWDLATETVLKSMSSNTSSTINTLRQLSDLNLAAGSEFVHIWDSGSGQLLDTLYGENNSVNALIELTDGRLVSGGLDSKVVLWKKGEWLGSLFIEGVAD